SSGNLNFHLSKLSEVNYVKIRKSILTGRLQTIIEITQHGESAFKEYIEKVKHVLKQV
ncbi:MAG: transcriptional regulator, partial [Candidatus Heimdallarchaeota archaeon]